MLSTFKKGDFAAIWGAELALGFEKQRNYKLDYLQDTAFIYMAFECMEETMEEDDIREICRVHQLQCGKITQAFGSFDKELYAIDDKYLIRTSRRPMYNEQIKFDRIRDLKHVPRIVYASDQGSSKPGVYYLILEYIKGCELFDNYKTLNERDICDIGTEIADFLIDLHTIKGEKYDIGHYVPIIPGYDKSWRSGHERYWDSIYKGLKDIQLPDSVRNSLELANDYINTNISSLDFENGPSLLHNDFHYKNIIIHNNTFSGVIDWECSQYGEADFDLVHLLHWSIFPPTEGIDMTDLLHQIFHLYTKKNRIPMIEKRLTIYLLEHDFIQILWSQGKKADEYVPRINWWLSTRLEQYILRLIDEPKNLFTK